MGWEGEKVRKERWRLTVWEEKLGKWKKEEKTYAKGRKRPKGASGEGLSDQGR